MASHVLGGDEYNPYTLGTFNQKGVALIGTALPDKPNIVIYDKNGHKFYEDCLDFLSVKQKEYVLIDENNIFIMEDYKVLKFNIKSKQQ